MCTNPRRPTQNADGTYFLVILSVYGKSVKAKVALSPLTISPMAAPLCVLITTGSNRLPDMSRHAVRDVKPNIRVLEYLIAHNY